MPNRLIDETSPYLLQHAHNPVDWHPWGAEAFALARQQDKPVLLSVGYSACHWCHVMAHESFEDPQTAALMNELFVNVKVDREERPDVDQIYQNAHALLTHRNGGWPLTMFLSPDQRPFFGGTYFPREPRYQLPGFKELLRRVAEAYRAQREEIARQNESLLEILRNTLPRGQPASEPWSEQPLQQALEELERIFDGVHGGFGGAPKFPHPAELDFCLRRHAQTGDPQARRIAVFTLEKMLRGGVYDQLRGGFYRYSVDGQWTIPHFEKMLYDNGPLLRLLADAGQLSGDPLFRGAAEQTAAWVMEEMQAPEGGYYATLDADSEDEEGKFYLWTPEQAAALLNPEEYAVAAPYFGLTDAPNFENHAWHLTARSPLRTVAESLGKSSDECEHLLASARDKLLQARGGRVAPSRDEKILTAWNGLMIAGMARAGRVYNQAAWVASARRAADFLRRTAWRDGRLSACHKDGRTRFNGYLDDYAFLLQGLLELLQAEFRAEHLAFARDLAEALLERFHDPEAGGFFFTSHDHEPLIHRPKPAEDNATPSGNGIAAGALQRLGHLLGEPRYLEAAATALKLFYPALTRHPSAHCTLLSVLEEALEPPTVVILRGESATLEPWDAALAGLYLPHASVFRIPPSAANLPAALDKPAIPGAVNAWVCRGVICLSPIVEPERLVEVLKEPGKS